MPYSKAELIRGYFAAYGSGDRKVIEDGFADDFTFTSPYDDAIDKATYFERCWPNNERMTTTFSKPGCVAESSTRCDAGSIAAPCPRASSTTWPAMSCSTPTHKSGRRSPLLRNVLACRIGKPGGEGVSE